MKSTFKKLVISIIIILFLLTQSNFVFASQESVKYLTIAGGGIGGMAYPYSGAVSSIVNNLTDLEIAVEASGGSVEIVQLLKRGESDIGTLMCDVWFKAYSGLGDYDKIDKLRGLHTMYQNIWYLITLADSNIMSYQDIRGKRVSVGSPGSGTEFKARRVLESMGITYDDFRVEYLSNVEMINGLGDGVLDAAFFTLPFGASAIIELDLTKDIRIIGLEDADIDKLTTEYPEYARAVIPEGSYNAVKSDIPTVSLWMYMVTTSDLPEDVAYTYVKTVMENLDKLSAAHPGGKYSTPENSLASATAPLHPGAIKYYEEIGLTVPTHLVP